MRNLKQTELQRLEERKERPRIRREHTKTENHKKQRPATLKRLKRGNDNELERNLKLESIANSSGWPWRQKKKEEQDWSSYQTVQFGHGDGQRKKIKTGEDGSYRTAHVSPY